MIFLSFVIISSCHQGQDKLTSIGDEPITRTLDYEVHEIMSVQGVDTTMQKELRFFNIKSALDAHAMMNDFYREFDDKHCEKVPSKYQNYINQIIWYKINLLGDQQEFTVVTDGTETQTDYFSALIVFDSSFNNCFESNHPLRDEIIASIVPKMKKTKKKGKWRNKKYYMRFY